MNPNAGFYPSTFLQLANGSKNSFLNWVLKLYFLISLQVLFLYVYVEKPQTDFFILLHHCFYSCKPQIYTKQTGLTIRFVIPRKILCSCIQKIKNKHDGGEDVAFFVSACITHSLVERLAVLTALLGNKDKSPGNEEA